MKLYANLKDVFFHPIKYLRWRSYAVRIWAQAQGNECESFGHYLKHGL